MRNKTTLALVLAITVLFIGGVFCILAIAPTLQVKQECSKNERKNLSTDKCEEKLKVVNGAEEKKKGQTTYNEYTIEDSSTDFTLSISSNTVNAFDFSTKAGNLNTGDKYIYIDPETNFFEVATEADIKKMKSSGTVCLSADDAWQNIGKDTCVAFYPTYWHKDSNIIFANEKKDYKDGFVAPVMNESLSWDDSLSAYRGKTIVVTGKIERYEGHPEIKIYSKKNIKLARVFGWSSTRGFIYTDKY